MSNRGPTFSVIIPIYNNRDTIARAIQSVLNQRYMPEEIIVIDDGSSDGCRTVIESFGPPVKYVYQENSGVSTARNRGADLATGEWLAFLDADDEFLDNRLSAHAEWIQADPELDFLLGDQESRTPEGEFLERFIEKSAAGRRLLKQNPFQDRIALEVADFEDLIADGFSEIRTISVRRNNFLALGGFDKTIKIGEDLHFFIRLFAGSKKGGVTPKVMATYYIFPNSALRKDPLQAMEQFVFALDSLSTQLRVAPKVVRRGYAIRLQSARLSLAYAYLRAGKKAKAITSILPNFLSQSFPKSFKDTISICIGFRRPVKISRIQRMRSIPANVKVTELEV